MSETIKLYDLLMRERGMSFGSNLSIIRCANELVDSGYVVYIGVSDLTIPEMKHLIYGYFYQNSSFELDTADNLTGASIVFFNESRVRDFGYSKNLRKVRPSDHVAIIASASTISFVEEYNLLIHNPEIAIVVYDWNGVIPKGSDDIMNMELDRNGLTLSQLTQKDYPSAVFMDIFEYGVTLLTAGICADPRCKFILSTISVIHDALANKPKYGLSEKRKIRMEHDVTNDIFLIESEML